MKVLVLICSFLINTQIFASSRFISTDPFPAKSYEIDGAALCATAKETLAYLNRGEHYDPKVIHDGKVFRLPLSRVKSTLKFICQHQKQMQDPVFIKQHFEFFRWYPDLAQAKYLRKEKTLIAHLPADKILMTKYYVHRAKASTQKSSAHPFALYGLPQDEALLTLEEAETKPDLLRFHYGKQAILKGVLDKKNVPVLAYLTREDLEAALLQGTLIADFNAPLQHPKIFNVHRCNNIAYDKAKNPYLQDRYWYFKPVAGIKGYGKDADHKITVNTQVTFAADLEQFGLGKMLMIQYLDQEGTMITRMGIFADTGGAFQSNSYQVDYLAGSYAGRAAFTQATKNLPDYVFAYFMVLKK